jgi:predicted acyltransferase
MKIIKVIMETKKINEAGLAGAGQKLLAHSKSAEFTANRGLVMELFPFILGAADRMSAKAISEWKKNRRSN